MGKGHLRHIPYFQTDPWDLAIELLRDLGTDDGNPACPAALASARLTTLEMNEDSCW